MITKFQLAASSMEQLKIYYFQHFGEQLPLTQYMSLYDNWQASSHKMAPAQPEKSAEPSSAVLNIPAGSRS